METNTGSSARMSDDPREDVRQAAGNLRDNAADMANKAMSAARDYGRQGVDYISDQAGAIKQSTESMVKKNPWYAIGVAVGAGVILGFLLRGSTRD